MKLRVLVMCLGLGSTVVRGENLRITDVTVDTGAVYLAWQPAQSLGVVEVSTNLSLFAPTGDVRSENIQVPLAPAHARAYFRVREVQVVEFPDVALHLAVHDAIVRTHGKKLAPPHHIYDCELPGIQMLDASGRGIRDLSGLEQLPDLRTLDVSGNQAIEFNLTALPNLVEFNCVGNQLTSLTLGACRKLEILRCESNRLTNLDVRRCLALRTLTCNDNRLGGRLDLSLNRRLVTIMAQHNALREIRLGREPTSASTPTRDPGVRLVAYVVGVTAELLSDRMTLDVALAPWEFPHFDNELYDQAFLRSILRSGTFSISSWDSQRPWFNYLVTTNDVVLHTPQSNMELEVNWAGYPVSFWCNYTGEPAAPVCEVDEVNLRGLFDVVSGALMVTFHPGHFWFADFPDAADHGIRYDSPIGFGGHLLKVPSGEEWKWAKLLAEDPAVRYANPDGILYPLSLSP